MAKKKAAEERDLSIKRREVIAPRGTSWTERLLLATHEFRQEADQSITHLVDGEVRANMPPDSWPDYVEQVPAAFEAVREVG